MPLVEVCYTNQLLICLSLVLVILTRLEVGLIDSPLLAIVPLLVVILLLGIEKSINVVARSSAKVEYREMAHTASEMLWVRSFLRGLGLDISTPMQMHSDNQATILDC